MNPIVVLVVVLVVCKYLNLPDSVAWLLAAIAAALEALRSLSRWATEYNAVRLKKVVHE